MTKEEAIEHLRNMAHHSYPNEEYLIAIKALEEPSYNSVKSELDAISRQTVLDMLEDINAETEGVGFYYEHYVEYIKKLPPVKPQPKTGHWISHYDEDAKEGWYECDRCHTERAFNTNYCPDCGARMIDLKKGEEE